MPLADIKLIDHGLAADHNMPCAVCKRAPAVYWLNQSVFEPCWECQQNGWKLVRSKWHMIKAWFKP